MHFHPCRMLYHCVTQTLEADRHNTSYLLTLLYNNTIIIITTDHYNFTTQLNWVYFVQNGVSLSLCFLPVVCMTSLEVVNQRYCTYYAFHLLLAFCKLSCMHLVRGHMENMTPKDHKLRMVILEQTERNGQ